MALKCLSFTGLVYELLRHSSQSGRHGAQASLAYFLSKLEVGSKLENISILHYYPDVFVEVTGLPPDREIELTIDLVLGT
jgi:hypothetical protein